LLLFAAWNLNAADRRQLGAKPADRQSLSLIEGCKLQTMLEANLVAHHNLDTQLGRVGRHYELQRNHAPHRHFFRKRHAEPAFGDLVAVCFEVTLVEGDRDR
jgi:hypothetical protein